MLKSLLEATNVLGPEELLTAGEKDLLEADKENPKKKRSGSQEIAELLRQAVDLQEGE